MSYLGQSKLASFSEALINVAIGFGIALATQLILFPMFNIHVNMSTNLWITFWFTLVSIVRSFILRRLFNHLTLWRLARGN